ncbi:tail fiber assembly protein [Phyllobacterium sp. YR531]|uniref:tail fiber assembly protein n=1 Tax=Phyllobacterium sp. YR531 TaxID=1144343 RepID=UPI00026FB242|nr:tail fiber assembly protein [Phyllobacterium sp. YR531]EJN04220.1 hypothetical protein PMI41_01859 [Phyllobacterium sp. YR531]
MKTLQEVKNWISAVAYSVADTMDQTGITAASYDRLGSVEIIRNGMAKTIFYDVVEGKAQNSLSQELLDWIEAGNEIKPFDTALLVEEAWQALRARRNAILAETDWTQMPDAPVDTAKWAAYRQALRDMTNGLEDPTMVIWPVRP